MKKTTNTLCLAFATALLSGCGGGSGPTALKGVDLSPNQPNAKADGDHAYTGGVTVGLAGDEKALYAVSLDAGVWKSQNGAPWTQLSNSPRYSFSIAVDPSRPDHLAVGERDGDLADKTKNQSGVWESFDGGATFTNYFNPRSNGGCANSQAIPSLVFTRKNSVLIAATPCGLAVNAGGNMGWKFPTTPLGNSPVTAVAASATKVWARNAAGTLIVSNDDGKTFNLATNKPIPAGIQFAGGGDAYSLAAFDDFAAMSTLGGSIGNNNFNQLLIYVASSDEWFVQKRLFDFNEGPNSPSRNGTGGGSVGRRFLNAFEFSTQAGPIETLIFCSGQELFGATAEVLDPKDLIWTKIAGGGLGTAIPRAPMYKPSVHADFWSGLVSASGIIWLGTDGGVFQNRQDYQGWLTQNDGLHTHHVNMIFSPPLNTAFAYPTVDNSAWFAGFTQNWAHDDSGDSNWVVGDYAGSPPFAFAAREQKPLGTTLCGFDNNVPNQHETNPGKMVKGVWRAADQTFDGPLTFNVIQTLYTGEPRPNGPMLDAVMLVKLPLQYYEGDDPAKPLKTVFPNEGKPFAIVRNKQWLQHPSIGSASGAGWEMMADSLPPGAAGFKVAGGHQKPQLFVITNVWGTIDLWRWDGNTKANWKKLDIRGGGQPSGLLLGKDFTGALGSYNAPVFVNPYRPNRLYALTVSGVRTSNDGGDTWIAETALTNAITKNGAYPLVGNFGDDFSNLPARGHGPYWGLATLSDMSFDMVNPERVAAASPYTGVFFNKGDGAWHDLGAGLPKPYTPVSSIFLFGNYVNVGLQGRGLWQIQGLDGV